MKVGFVLDNPKRELDGLLLVAEELASVGHEVFIIPMYQQGLDIPLLGLDAVVMNYVRPNNGVLLTAYRRLGVHVFVMDTEGGVLSEQGANAPGKWAQSMRESRLMDLMDDYLFWGRNVYEAFKQHSGKDPARLHLTGNPRFDFCEDRWRSLLTYPIADYVLVNTNFSAINPLFNRSDEEELEVLIAAGWERTYIAPLLADLKTVFEKYLDTLVWLVERNPDITFLVRPHPFERDARYRDVFSAHPNVIVDGSGNVLNVIAHARCVLHLNCGTAAEACLMGKLPVSMEFLNTERLLRHTPLPSRVSLAVSSREELDALVKKPEPFAWRYDAAGVYAKYIEPWFYLRDGQAYSRVSCVILEAIENRVGRKTARRYGMAARGCFPKPQLLQRLQGVAACVVGSLAVARLREYAHRARATKSMGIEDILRDLERIAGIKGRKSRYRVAYARHPLHKAKMASIHVFSVDK
jgi:surface carbohydrate biosynthesis protein